VATGSGKQLDPENVTQMFGPLGKDATEKLDSPGNASFRLSSFAAIDATMASVHIFVAIAWVYFPVLGSSFHTVLVFFWPNGKVCIEVAALFTSPAFPLAGIQVDARCLPEVFLSDLPWKTCPEIPAKILAAAFALTASLELAAAAAVDTASDLHCPALVARFLPATTGTHVLGEANVKPHVPP